jgi:hypothetical protein
MRYLTILCPSHKKLVKCLFPKEFLEDKTRKTNYQKGLFTRQIGGTHHAERLVNPKILVTDFGHPRAHALGYPKSVTKKFCTHFWVNKSLSMMWEINDFNL